MLYKTDNTALNFVEAGEGKITLVFLHYFGGSSNSWSGVITELKKFFHCIAIDLCGFGHSPAPGKELSVHDNATLVIKLIQDLQLKKYVLIGHSMGGKIAVSISSQKQAGLLSLILIAPSPPTPEPMTDEDRKDLINAFGNRSAIERLIKKITAKTLEDSTFEETVQEHLKASYIAWNAWIAKGSREDISTFINHPDVPVLIISGSLDPNFSGNFLKTEFIKYFSDATFEEIEGAGHLLPVEAPLTIAKLINNFIKISTLKTYTN